MIARLFYSLFFLPAFDLSSLLAIKREAKNMVKSKLGGRAFVVACLLTTASIAHAQAEPPAPPARGSNPAHSISRSTQNHISRAMRLARRVVPAKAISAFFNTTRLANLVDPALLPLGADNFGGGKEHPAIPATKVFDQLYYIGSEHVGAYVLVTPAGIIQWDAMNDGREAEQVIEAGYKALGLDPQQIRYLVITHAHGDHYGGVSYFTTKYPGIKVLASATDWDVMDGMRTNRPFGGPPPARGQSVADGEVLELGGTRITFAITPGHTPGTLSSFIPVTDKGRPHLMAMFGGVGVPQNPAALEQYDSSWTRFGSLAAKVGADGVLSTHPAYEGGLFYITEPESRKRNGNSWVLGRTGLRTYIAAVHEAVAGVRGIRAETMAKR
jgi:metallo-beta-lactamase class B